MKPSSPLPPHDRLFKYTFADPARLAEFAKSFLPKRMVDALVWERLERAPGSFTDKRLGESLTDLLFTVPLRDRPSRKLYLYFLVEHRSTPDREMPYRVLRYMLRIWEDWKKRNKKRKARFLPPIVPLIIHHGPNGWTAPSRLSEMFRLTPAEREAFAANLPELGLKIVDLGFVPQEQIWAAPMEAVSKLFVITLATLARRADLLEALARWAVGSLTHRLDPDQLEALQAWMVYTLRTTSLEDQSIIATLEPHLSPKETAAVNYVANSFYERALNKGRQEGLEKGLEEGLEKGQVRTVLKLIASRYGNPSEAVRRRVEEATAEERDAWIERVFTAKTLDELLG